MHTRCWKDIKSTFESLSKGDWRDSKMIPGNKLDSVGFVLLDKENIS